MKNLFLLALTILSLEMYSQSGTIRGRVIGEDNLPLPGAKILTDDDNGAISDRDGFYTLLKVQEGSRTLTVTYIGFETQTKKVELKGNTVLRTDFKMEGEMELEAVVITGVTRGQAKAFNQQNSNINVSNIVAADQIGRFPDANIGDALKRIPGISVQYDQGEARKW